MRVAHRLERTILRDGNEFAAREFVDLYAICAVDRVADRDRAFGDFVLQYCRAG